MARRLWHYTCDHCAPLIAKSRILLVNPAAKTAGVPPVIWLTDLDRPMRAALGLESLTLDCDRTAWRVLVETDSAERWNDYAKRTRVPHEYRESLEAQPGRLPRHWYVSELPCAVLAVERA